MAISDITLVDSKSTPENHVFTERTQQGGQIIRANQAASLDTPETLMYATRKAKAHGVEVINSVVKLEVGHLDADGVTTRYMSVRQIWDIDPKIYTDARAEDLTAMMNSCMTEARAKLFMKGYPG